jgi:glycosyltransferase involved in cell wall biosynthesis
MRIGVDARVLSQQLTGIGVYLKCLLDALQALDHKNYYYLLSHGQINFEIGNPHWEKIEGRCQRKYLSTFWMQYYGPNIASDLKLDLFWGSRHQLPLFLHRGIKTVLTIHDIVHLLYPQTMAMPNLLAERLLMKRSIQRADFIIADSKSTASGIQKEYRIRPDKVDVVYPGSPILRGNIFDCRTDDNGFYQKYFLFVGTLEPRKNIEFILAAFAFLKPEHHGIGLVVVGDVGWKNKATLKKLESHIFNSRIHLTGYVTTDRLLSIYKNALCLLFPSLYEGFGFPILEAMACGTPVITSNVSSMPEVAGDAALLVDPYDVHALVEAMDKIIKDGNLRAHLISKGFERVKQFSWDRCARETLGVFERVHGEIK